MKILVVLGSPHKKGSSNLLAEQFITSAVEQGGHDIEIVDIAHANIHPCLGCDYCAMNGLCCQKDDMENIKVQIMNSDMIVFVTPLYYFGMSAQLKMFIDRFYSFNGELTSKHMKSALIAAAWNNNGHTMDDLYRHYQTLCDYLNFEDMGTVLGLGCGTVAMTQNTQYPRMAYELGKQL